MSLSVLCRYQYYNLSILGLISLLKKEIEEEL